MQIQRDQWQEEVIAVEGDLLIAKGRRIGATHIMAEKAIEHLMSHQNTHPTSQIVCVSLTEEQAKLIILFALEYAQTKYKKFIGRGPNKPTLNRIVMVVRNNRRILLAKPVGNTGDATRGFEGQVLMVDEASRMPHLFWVAAKPILLTQGGSIWMWSTFHGKEGYFWEKFDESYNKKNPKARFKHVWLKDSEEVIYNRKICNSWTQSQHDGAIRILEEEKRDMSVLEYSQEYLAKPLEELRRFFDDELIDKACTEEKNPNMPGKRYLGVDIGRRYDPSAFQDFGKGGDIVYHADSQTTQNTLTNKTQDKIKDMNRAVNYKQIGIDAGSGSLGVGVYDNLMIVPEIKRKLMAMNNRAIALDRDGKKKQNIKKLDYYNHLKSMMEDGKVKLLNDGDVKASFRSIQWEIIRKEDRESKVRIFGNDDHIVEGIHRGVWLASKDKSLNNSIYWM